MSHKKKFVELLEYYIKEKYPNVIFTHDTPTSPWIEFTEFGSKLYVNSSKEYKNNTGWYDLNDSIYNRIIDSKNSFIAVILGEPEKTFIFPQEKTLQIFNEENKLDNKDRPRWMFSIVKKNDNNYFLKIKKDNINVNDYLNRWDLIPEMHNKLIEDNNNRNFFLIQVSEYGSQNILNNSTYEHSDWKSNQRDYDHGKVKIGDYLLVYFSGNAIDFQQQLKKIYRVDFISKDNIQFKLYEVKDLSGITLKKIQEAVVNKILPKTFRNLGLQGFNIAKIDKSDYDSILLLDKNFVNMNELQVFLTGYPQGNLQISKEQNILGWKKKPKFLSEGDYVFVYNTTNKKIECGFKIKSKSNIQKPIWEDEINSDSSLQKYQFRWDAELTCDNLNINLNDISQIEPFEANNNGKKANFGFLVGRNSPNSLRNPVYKPFKDYLLSKCGHNQMKNEQISNWSFDIEEAINQILLPDTESELAIHREIVKRILIHLKSGKHIILVGPPGVGKTESS